MRGWVLRLGGSRQNLTSVPASSDNPLLHPQSERVGEGGRGRGGAIPFLRGQSVLPQTCMLARVL